MESPLTYVFEQMMGSTVLLEPTSGIELLILSKLSRLEYSTSSGMERQLHLQRDSVLKALNDLSDRGLIQVSKVRRGKSDIKTHNYSLAPGNEPPKMEFGAKGGQGLSIEPSFIRKCSILELNKLHPFAGSDSTKSGKWPRVFAQREKRRINQEISKLEKDHWAHSKNSLESLYYVAMEQFKLVLHLFLSELVALHILYQARIISSVEFKKSFEKLSLVYFGAHLSGELSEIIIQRFIELVYPNSNSNELGINLAKEFRK